MKKKIISIILIVVMTFSLVVTIPFSSVGAISRSDVVSKLQSLMNQYVGKTATSAQMYRGEQCKGFANWVFLQIFGVYIGGYPENAKYKINTDTADLLGELAPGSLNESSCRELLLKGAPGDYIQVQRSTARGSGPHSMILVDVNNSGIEVFDCNSDGKNSIKRYTITWSQFDVANKGMSLLRAKGYIPGPTEKPSNVSLSKNQYWYDIKDTITLYPNADNATSYWLSVYKDNNHIVDQAIDGEFSFQASQWGYGDYYAWITASNSCGSTDSEGINFTVCGAPSYTGISTSKAFYDWDADETVEITVNSVCAKGHVIGIDSLDDNLNYVKRVVTDGSDSTYRISAKSLGVGYFSAYFSVYNGSGSIDTKSVKFYIGQKKDLGSDFYAKIKNDSSNKYLTVVDNNVEGKDYSNDNSQVWHFKKLEDGSYKIINCNDGRALDVDNYASAGAGSNVHIYNDWDSTAQRFYIYELCGAYYIKPQCTDLVLDMSQSTYNLEVWGSSFDWHPQKFSIEKLSPGNPQIALNKTKFTLDENITVNASADYSVQYYTVQVYKQDKVVYTKDFEGCTIDIPARTLGKGDYTVLVSCTNSSGTATTEKISFSIIDNVTTTSTQPTIVTTKPTTVTTTTQPTTVTTKPTIVTTTTEPTTVTMKPTTVTTVTSPTKKEFVISSLLLNVTTDNVEKKIIEGNKYTAILKPEKGYKLDSVKIKMGDMEITVPFVDDTCTINIPNVNGDISIIAVAVKKVEPTTVTTATKPTTVTTKPTTITTVTTPTKKEFVISSLLLNVTTDNVEKKIIEGNKYTAILKPEKGYKLDSVKIKMGDMEITVPFVDDTCTINIPNVNGDISIIAVAVKKVEPTTVTTGTSASSTTELSTLSTSSTTVSTSEQTTSTVTETEPSTTINTIPSTTKPTVNKITKVALNKKSVTLNKGKSTTVKATVTPANATNKKLKWTTSNSRVATVSQSGKITAKGRGIATIKTMSTDGSNKYATLKVTVKQPVTSVKLNRNSVNLKVKGNAKQKTVTLKAKVYPNNANNKTVKWSTSKSKIAIVNSKGKVTAKKKGTCYIIATAKDGSKKSAKCKITVK